METIDRAGVLAELDRKASSGVSLILPIAAVIETIQHVQRIENGSDRRRCAQNLDDRMTETLTRVLPWNFVQTAWDEDLLRDYFAQTPPLPPTLVESLSLKAGEAGDLLLMSEFRRLRSSYTSSLFDVDVWTHDNKLRAFIQAMRD